MTLTPFLSAKWKHLVMINYEIDPSVLASLTPAGTEIDFWNGKTYISLVGFMFLDTTVKGVSIPFHRHFEEVNLRFYLKRGEKRGVAFIKEIVPKRAIAYIARRLYNENYVALPMKHHITEQSAEYLWKSHGKWQKIGLRCRDEPHFPLQGSQEEFITEHYYGYSEQRDGSTMEYEVKHPQWRVSRAEHYEVDIDVKGIYGPLFAPFLEKKPSSAFLAEGSEITVFRGVKI